MFSEVKTPRPIEEAEAMNKEERIILCMMLDV
jgi:hypothetical protein